MTTTPNHPSGPDHATRDIQPSSSQPAGGGSLPPQQQKLDMKPASVEPRSVEAGKTEPAKPDAKLEASAEVKPAPKPETPVSGQPVAETKPEAKPFGPAASAKPPTVSAPVPTAAVPSSVSTAQKSSALFQPHSAITGQAAVAKKVDEADHPMTNWWMDLWKKLWATDLAASSPFASVGPTAAAMSAKDDAKNRLRLVLMHDRTQLTPQTIESMRDELVDVISKYVEIDRDSLDLYLEQEADTIALVANLHVARKQA